MAKDVENKKRKGMWQSSIFIWSLDYVLIPGAASVSEHGAEKAKKIKKVKEVVSEALVTSEKKRKGEHKQ